MAVDPLAILFGSQARVKLLRFFLFNPSKEFSFDDISRRARLVRRTARTEIDALLKAGVIKKKVFFEQQVGGDKKIRVHGFALDKSFPELQALQTFLFETAPLDGKHVAKQLRKAGTLDCVVLAGVFVRNFEQRLDMLIAMKKLDEKKLESAIRGLESEIGIEIRYAALTTEDLVYRVGMHDRLTRDVFDYPHELLIDRIEIRDELHRP
ncbi:MAG TPA: hypothetical protein VKP88_04935 [Candidatus Paceibacterota bacterium]|nr:hypothetical protein [Candidatus Paceibacterota bacterium]